MGFLRIHCGDCGGTWEVYGHDDFRNAKNKICPHCFANIDGQDWKNAVVPAFGAMLDLNRTLQNTSTGYHAPLFSVDYVADTRTPTDQERIKQSIRALENCIDAMRGDLAAAGDRIDAALQNANAEQC